MTISTKLAIWYVKDLSTHHTFDLSIVFGREYLRPFCLYTESVLSLASGRFGSAGDAQNVSGSRSVYSCSGHMSDAQTLHPLHCNSFPSFGGEFDDLDQAGKVVMLKISQPSPNLIYLFYLAESTCIHLVDTLGPSYFW